MLKGQVINCAQGEYPELDGLEDGAQVQLMIKATVNSGENESHDITFDDVEFETDNQADRDMKSMSKQNYVGASSGQSKKMGDDF